MSMFTLAIYYLTTSNLPWFMDLTFQVPMQCCSLQQRTLLPSPVTSTTGCCFALVLSLYSFWSYFSTDLQKHTGHLLTWGIHLSVSYHFAFSCCSWGSQGKNTEVLCHSLLQWTTFCQTSPPWPVHLGWPHTAWLSFTDLDKAVVLWSDWLVFYDCGFSLSAVHGVARSRTRLSDFTLTFHLHALKKEMATHSSVLAWRIPGTGEPGGLPSMGSHRVGHDWSDLAAAAAVVPGSFHLVPPKPFS